MGSVGTGYLLRELDIVKDDEGSFDIEDSTVVNARSDVVVPLGSLDVDLRD